MCAALNVLNQLKPSRAAISGSKLPRYRFGERHTFLIEVRRRGGGAPPTFPPDGQIAVGWPGCRGGCGRFVGAVKSSFVFEKKCCISLSLSRSLLSREGGGGGVIGDKNSWCL